jgi:hypothetical protein
VPCCHAYMQALEKLQLLCLSCTDAAASMDSQALGIVCHYMFEVMCMYRLWQRLRQSAPSPMACLSVQIICCC